MSERTPFAGLLRLAPTDTLAEDNFAFQDENPRLIDAFLKIAALTHRHDGHPALAHKAPPLDPVLAAGTSGGTIPADTSVTVGYTLLDVDGGETVLNDNLGLITTASGLADPETPPNLAITGGTGGSLLADTYYYAVSVQDAFGGETAITPLASIILPPGSASKSIDIGGLDAIVTESGGTRWRLWRRKGSGNWTRQASGTDSIVTDDGTLCPDCTEDPPLDNNSTNSVNTLQVTVPGSQPLAAVRFRIYASLDGTFTSPCLLGDYPIADAGVVKTFTALAFEDGAPPSSPTAVPGAHLIDPATEIDGLAWRQSVADIAHLPGEADDGWVILVRDSDGAGTPGLYYWLSGTWNAIVSGGGGGGSAHWKDPVANAGALPASGNITGDVRVTLDNGHIHYWDSAAWADASAGAPASVPGHIILDEATARPARSKLSFQGTGVAVTDDSADDETVVTINTGAGGAHVIQDENVDLPGRAKLSFEGPTVVASDDLANDRTKVVISAADGMPGLTGPPGPPGQSPVYLRARVASAVGYTSTGTAHVLELGAEDFDTGDFFDPADPTKVTLHEGAFAFGFDMKLLNDAGGGALRQIRVLHHSAGGSQEVAIDRREAMTDTVLHCGGMVDGHEGEWLTFELTHNQNTVGIVPTGHVWIFGGPGVSADDVVPESGLGSLAMLDGRHIVRIQNGVIADPTAWRAALNAPAGDALIETSPGSYMYQPVQGQDVDWIRSAESGGSPDTDEALDPALKANRFFLQSDIHPEIDIHIGTIGLYVKDTINTREIYVEAIYSYSTLVAPAYRVTLVLQIFVNGVQRWVSDSVHYDYDGVTATFPPDFGANIDLQNGFVQAFGGAAPGGGQIDHVYNLTGPERGLFPHDGQYQSGWRIGTDWGATDPQIGIAASTELPPLDRLYEDAVVGGGQRYLLGTDAGGPTVVQTMDYNVRAEIDAAAPGVQYTGAIEVLEPGHWVPKCKVVFDPSGGDGNVELRVTSDNGYDQVHTFAVDPVAQTTCSFDFPSTVAIAGEKFKLHGEWLGTGPTGSDFSYAAILSSRLQVKKAG